ncbi:MAG: hypothetical protein AAFR33_14525 [Pseudomonadota bacterium]
MDDMKSDPDLDVFLAPAAPDQEIDPEHRAWIDDEIAKTLEKKRRGELGYTPLDEARKRFGL